MSERGPGRPQEASPGEIRDVARALFAEHGYDQTSLAQVAAAVGISRTTLFAYYPAKRDLIWEEFDDRDENLREHLATVPHGRLVDVLVSAMLVIAHYRREEHDAFAFRLHIVRQSKELRAYTALRTTELAALLISFAESRAPRTDPRLVGDVTHALMAVAARATDDWAEQASPEVNLDTYLADRLRPFAIAMSGLGLDD